MLLEWTILFSKNIFSLMVIILFNLAAFYVYMESLVLYVCKCVLLFVYVCVGACTFNLCVIVSFLHVHVIV